MLATQEWMTVIDAAIQGVPEEAQRRRQTVTSHYTLKGRPKLSRQSTTPEKAKESGGRQPDLPGSKPFDLSGGGDHGAAAYAVNES